MAKSLSLARNHVSPLLAKKLTFLDGTHSISKGRSDIGDSIMRFFGGDGW